VYLEMRHKR